MRFHEIKSQLDEKCWTGYHRVKGTKAGAPGSCAKNEGVAEGGGEQMSKAKALNALRKQLMNEYPYMKCANLEEFKQRLQWLSEGMLKNNLTNEINYKINEEEIALYQAYRKRREQIQQGSQGVAEGNLSEGKSSQFVYHVTPTKNLKSIAKKGLIPKVGDRASQIPGEKIGIYVFPDKVSAEDAVMNWLGDEFEDEPLTMLKIDISGLEKNITKGADYELIVGTTIEPKRIKKVNIQLEESFYKQGLAEGSKHKCPLHGSGKLLEDHETEAFIIYVDGTEVVKDPDQKEVLRLIDHFKKRYPNRKVELKREVCKCKQETLRELPATEGLNKQQQKVGQLGPLTKAKKISPVLGKPEKPHPFQGKLVGASE